MNSRAQLHMSSTNVDALQAMEGSKTMNSTNDEFFIDDEGLQSTEDRQLQCRKPRKQERKTIKVDGKTITFGSYIDTHNNETIPVLIEVPDGTDEPETGIMHYIRKTFDEDHWGIQVIATVASCFLTYAIINRGPKLNWQIAAMVMITLAGATFPQLITAVACGVFAGQTFPETVPSYPWLTLLAAATAVSYQVAQRYKLLVGYCGRLGTTTFLAMNFTALVGLGPSGAMPWSQYGSASALWNANPQLLEQALVSVIACIFSSSFSGYFRLVGLPKNPVLVPCAFALLCMLVVSVTEYNFAIDVCNGLAVGAYVAMASTTRLPSTKAFAFVGVIAGLWIILLGPFFIGFGGRSGFTAFCGYLTYVISTKLISACKSESGLPCTSKCILKIDSE